ncbi:hypothetical protein EZY14_009065 [Kordia sp. TARA_039_SRF]|nr:hypothetical protein EZY14_009065 [Kordia sp. TARA_039_SRF]
MEINELTHNWKLFEQRNNLSTTLEINPDHSGCLHEFWDDEAFFEFSSIQELNDFFLKGELKKTKDGRSVSPVVILKQ